MGDRPCIEPDSCTLHRYFPILKWAPKYHRQHLFSDAVAGFTVALMVIPQGLAYADLAQLPHVYGLYSSFIGVIIYMFFGTARDVSLGPTAIMCLLIADSTQGNVDDAIVLALLVGLLQLVLGLLRLGILVDFISHAVISGFMAASAIIIAMSQFPKFLGIKARRDFIGAVVDIAKGLPHSNIPDLLLAVPCLLMLLGLKRLFDRQGGSSRVVFLLGIFRNALVVLVATLLAYCLAAGGHRPFTLVGVVPAGLPPVRAPHVSASQLADLMPLVPVVAMIGFLESISIAKTFARKNGYTRSLDASQELVALGMANTIASFFCAFPVTGSFSRTSINSQTGAKSSLSGLVTGLFVIFSLLVLTPAFYYIPQAALASVIITAVLAIVDLEVVRDLWRLGWVGRVDLVCWTVSLLGSLLLDIQGGMVAAIMLSAVILLYKLARPPILIVPVPVKDVVILRFEAPLIYANARYFQENVAQLDKLMAQQTPGAAGGAVGGGPSLLSPSAVLPVTPLTTTAFQQLTDTPATQPHRVFTFRDSKDGATTAEQQAAAESGLASPAFVTPVKHPANGARLDVGVGSIQQPAPTASPLDSPPLIGAAGNGLADGVPLTPVIQLGPDFGNSARLRGLVLEMSAVSYVDSSGLRILRDVCDDLKRREPSVPVRLAGVAPRLVPLVAQATGLSVDRFHRTWGEAEAAVSLEVARASPPGPGLSSDMKTPLLPQDPVL